MGDQAPKVKRVKDEVLSLQRLKSNYEEGVGDRVVGRKYTRVYENGIKNTRIKSIETTKIVTWKAKTSTFPRKYWMRPAKKRKSEKTKKLSTSDSDSYDSPYRDKISVYDKHPRAGHNTQHWDIRSRSIMQIYNVSLSSFQIIINIRKYEYFNAFLNWLIIVKFKYR